MKNIIKSIEINKNGATRFVLLTQKWAIKIPRLDSYRSFLNGLLANEQEIVWSKIGDTRLLTIEQSLPLGLLIIMPRVEPLSIKYQKLLENENVREMFYEILFEFTKSPYLIPAEIKLDSFGEYNGKLVCIDYG